MTGGARLTGLREVLEHMLGTGKRCIVFAPLVHGNSLAASEETS
jgi:hypothetical protein